MNFQNILGRVLRLVAAIIMLQTLYFKFSAQPESVVLFTKVGIEPWGRILTGVAELVASVLLLLPFTVFAGALLACSIMAGAIFAHVFVIGIESAGDGGSLFFLAIVVFVCSIILMYLYRNSPLAKRMLSLLHRK